VETNGANADKHGLACFRLCPSINLYRVSVERILRQRRSSSSPSISPRSAFVRIRVVIAKIARRKQIVPASASKKQTRFVAPLLHIQYTSARWFISDLLEVARPAREEGRRSTPCSLSHLIEVPASSDISCGVADADPCLQCDETRPVCQPKRVHI
jgi:hypothetical protein